MVRNYRAIHEYPDPPQIPLTAFFRRYPNPFARHVLSVDTLSRYIDPVTGRLHTTRLILKRGILPKWARRVLPLGRGGTGLDTWVLEESVVDPPGGAVIPGRDGGAELHDGLQTPGAGPSTYAESTQPGLRMLQGNMDHRKFMFVKEGGSIRAGKNGGSTYETTAEISSDWGGAWSGPLRRQIENVGMTRFERNTEKSRQGLSLIMGLLKSRQPLPDSPEYRSEISLIPARWRDPPEPPVAASVLDPSEVHGAWWTRWRWR